MGLRKNLESGTEQETSLLDPARVLERAGPDFGAARLAAGMAQVSEAAALLVSDTVAAVEEPRSLVLSEQKSRPVWGLALASLRPCRVVSDVSARASKDLSCPRMLLSKVRRLLSGLHLSLAPNAPFACHAQFFAGTVARPLGPWSANLDGPSDLRVAFARHPPDVCLALPARPKQPSAGYPDRDPVAVSKSVERL